MSLPNRTTLTSHIRSTSTASGSTAASPALLARISEKKAELAQLKELQALSAGLADQMETLESKLAMLSDGTEGEPFDTNDTDYDQSFEKLLRLSSQTGDLYFEPSAWRPPNCQSRRRKSKI